MVMTATRSASPFTQEATQVRITSLQPSQHYHNLQVTTQGPLVAFVTFLSAYLECWHKSLSCELHELEV